MRPLVAMRRFQGPLTLLVISLLFAAGCRSKTEQLYLKKPFEAYRAENGVVMLGYYIQPEIHRGYAGWHWLVIEPELAERMFEPLLSAEAVEDPDAVVAVSYEGWGSEAELIPPLTERGYTDPTVPKPYGSPVTKLKFIWDEDRGVLSLIDRGEAVLPWVRVTPGDAVLTTHELESEVLLPLVYVAAVAGLVTGVVLLDGSVVFSTYGLFVSY